MTRWGVCPWIKQLYQLRQNTLHHRGLQITVNVWWYYQLNGIKISDSGTRNDIYPTMWCSWSRNKHCPKRFRIKAPFYFLCRYWMIAIYQTGKHQSKLVIIFTLWTTKPHHTEMVNAFKHFFYHINCKWNGGQQVSDSLTRYLLPCGLPTNLCTGCRRSSVANVPMYISAN